jgi:hypothetical protein
MPTAVLVKSTVMAAEEKMRIILRVRRNGRGVVCGPKEVT